MHYSISELPPDDRPGEKLRHSGAPILSNSELLALIIRSGTKQKNAVDLSREILQEISFADIQNVEWSVFTQFKGIGPAKAQQIKALGELAVRLSTDKIELGQSVHSFQEVVDHIGPKMRQLEREQLRALHLSNGNQLLDETTLFQGTLDELQVSPREVVRSSMKANSKAVILVHNHPNGSCAPSQEDIEVTKTVDAALGLVDVQLLDHVIVGQADEMSFVREGYL